MNNINKVINFFFITLIINCFTIFYTIYNFLNFKIFQNKQGTKLDIKQKELSKKSKEVKNKTFNF